MSKQKGILNITVVTVYLIYITLKCSDFNSGDSFLSLSLTGFSYHVERATAVCSPSLSSRPGGHYKRTGLGATYLTSSVKSDRSTAGFFLNRAYPLLRAILSGLSTEILLENRLEEEEVHRTAYTSLYVCVCICVCVCVCLCIHACISVSMCLCVHACVSVCMCVSMHAYNDAVMSHWHLLQTTVLCPSSSLAGNTGASCTHSLETLL